eukprot:m.283933 g.283933  ORF g.283933 m.283933 type:complete len:476 (+) comp19892_c0_seq4:179-1606(+)
MLLVSEPEALRRYIRRIDKRNIPVLIACYTFALLDRANLGAVKEAISNDINLTEEGYALASGIFFATYISFSVPANLLVQRHGARRVLGAMMFLFGGVGACQALATNLTTLVVIRLLLGLTEAGVYPAVAFFLTLWYKPDERGQRLGYFQFAQIIAGITGGLIGYALIERDWAGLAGWQWLFIVEGVPAVVLGCVAFCVLADTPATTTWLSARERALAAKRIPSARTVDPVTPRTFKKVLHDKSTYLFALMFLCITTMTYQLSFYTPTIIRQLGYSLAVANLLSAPIQIVFGLLMFFVMRWSDRSGQRFPCIQLCASLAALGFGLVLVGDNWSNMPASYIGLCLATSGAGTLIPLTMAWLTDTLVVSSDVAVYTAVVVSIGNLGGIVGPQIYGIVGQNKQYSNGADADTADYRIAHTTMIGVAVLVFLLSSVIACTKVESTDARQRDAVNTNGGVTASETQPLLLSKGSSTYQYH